MGRSKKATEQVAKKIVAAILADLTDRRGLKQEWNQTDPKIQREIRAEWRAIVAAELDKEEPWLEKH